ncbi:TetR/AcrR family transcriptional regulator [Paraburkholderia susongensis]|uniref:Transcriptional regulator, TetR family n=1 Tax=Paraburkholderia susongensis TaxID=1515439 RepID=A0A1X7KLD1_9BURK|nr:TetR/AcrR family transcriptional regulator [Paraburkholderia susongensis]SMG41944.1 transcriptional regulator, TetR family [Paraburkholderia susongensis]
MTTASIRKGNERRAELIRYGVAILTEKGFHNFSIDELVALADVPKGSFHYYFANKDAYCLEVIDAYDNYFQKKLESHFGDTDLSPLGRIKAFTDDAAAGMRRHKYRRGCLIGNLGQELAALDETYRKVLSKVLQGWQTRLQLCLDEGKQCGEVGQGTDTKALARYFWSAWEGAVLCAKLEKSREPLDNVSSAFLAHVKARL